MDWSHCSSSPGTTGVAIPTLNCIGPLITSAIQIALSLVGTVSLLLIIFAGIKYITSGGGKQVDEAKNMLTYAIIGLLIVLVSVFVIYLVGGITGVTCILGKTPFSNASCN